MIENSKVASYLAVRIKDIQWEVYFWGSIQ